MQNAVHVIGGADEAAALLQPDRLRLLQELKEPNSASGLARRLDMPRQRLNYHLRELEKRGLVELVEERRKGNCTERIVRATALSYLISPEVLGALGTRPDIVRDRFSASYLIALASSAIRDLAVLRRRADKAGKKLSTLSLETEVRFASAAEREAFAGELSTALARLGAKYHDEKTPGGRLFRFIVGAYPCITRDESGKSIDGSKKKRR